MAMSRITDGRYGRLLIAIVTGALVTLIFAGTAYAHTEVEAEPAVAGATNALVTFTAEAESATAGVTQVRIVLPTGIAPADVTLVSAPPGWTFSPLTDGYSVGGPALGIHKDVVHSIRVRQLPNATRLVFKALVTYSNGDIDRWIEEPTAADPNPDSPAPVLNLQPNPNPPASSAPGATPSTVTTSSTPTNATEDNGGSVVPWLIVVLVALAGAGAALLLLRSRQASQ